MDFTRAEEVEMLGPAQIEVLQNVGRSLIQQICITFRVEPSRDYYGADESGGYIALA
jgi:hypothetical protein